MNEFNFNYLNQYKWVFHPALNFKYILYSQRKEDAIKFFFIGSCKNTKPAQYYILI